MKQFIYLSLFLVVLASNVTAQHIQLAKIDSLNIERSKKLANKILNSDGRNIRYLIFAIGNELLFVYDSANVYNFVFSSEQFNFSSQQKEFTHIETKQVDIGKRPLHRFWFRKKACSQSFVYTGNQNVPSHTNYIYFFMYDGVHKICEFNIPVQENVGLSKGGKLPLNKKLLNYLLGELLPYAAKRAVANHK